MSWSRVSVVGAKLIVCSVDTVGVHYSGTLWRWYRNWIGNADKVKEKYGQRWFRVSLFPPIPECPQLKNNTNTP